MGSIAMEHLARIVRRDDMYDNDNGSPYGTTGWVIVGIVIAVVVVTCVAAWFCAIHRITGVWAATPARARAHAARMRSRAPPDPEAADDAPRARPSRRSRRRARAFEADTDPVPTYHAGPGDNDAGYYDEHGNYTPYDEPPPPFEPPPFEPPKAMLRVSMIESPQPDMYELEQYRTASIPEGFEPVDPRVGAVRRDSLSRAAS